MKVFSPIDLELASSVIPDLASAQEQRRTVVLPLPEDTTCNEALIFCANGPMCERDRPGLRKVVERAFGAPISEKEWRETAAGRKGYLPRPLEVSGAGEPVRIAVGFTGFCVQACIHGVYHDEPHTPVVGIGRLVDTQTPDQVVGPMLMGQVYPPRDMLHLIRSSFGVTDSTTSTRSTRK